MSRPKGTRDFPPEAMERRRAAEAALRRVAEGFGYREVMTPTFEHLELFTTKSGEGVTKQLYHFKDKAGRDLTLRPEVTAPVMRYYVAELTSRPKPLKLYYVANCFRYEEPQSGRYREFWQFGTELLGPASPEAAAETIALARACMAALGLDNLALRVGHIGVLKEMASYWKLEDSDRQRLFSIIDKREVDSKRDEIEAILRRSVGGFVPDWYQFLVDLTSGNVSRSEISAKHPSLMALWPGVREAFLALGETLQFLKALGVRDFEEDLGVVRGLDYYTGVVFEFHSPDLGAESQVCGGGVYSLTEMFGAEPVGSTGFAIGFDRVLLAQENAGKAPPARAGMDAYVVPIGAPARARALEVATQLRAAGLRVDVDLMRRGPSKCLDYANATGARNVVLLGSKELERDVATVKDMASGEQREVPLGELAEALRPSTPA